MAVPVHKYQSLFDDELNKLLGQIENQEKLGWELYLINPEVWGGEDYVASSWNAVMRKQIE